MSENQVIIIGAGCAGLAAANMLKKSGVPAVIVEAMARPGGLVNDIRSWCTNHDFRAINFNHKNI